jgi:hypothetical protein
MASSGWYRDPTGQADGRYWDGARWSDQADRRGVTVSSPIDPAHAGTPPVAGSEYVAQRAAETPTVAVQPAKSSVVGSVFGAIAVVVAIVALVVALNNNGEDSGDETPTTPTTEAPATTEG